MEGTLELICLLVLVGSTIAKPWQEEKRSQDFHHRRGLGLNPRMFETAKGKTEKRDDVTCELFGQQWPTGEIPSEDPCQECECYDSGQAACFEMFCTIYICKDNEVSYKPEGECCARCVPANDIPTMAKRGGYEIKRDFPFLKRGFPF